jgi:hypothetical protein
VATRSDNRRRHRAGRPARLAAVLVIVATSVTTALAASVGAARAATPPSGPPAVVTMGDSYASGEAGRWAGNTNGSSSRIDALGPTAYFDNATDTAETIPLCHRSHADEAYIGGAVVGEDLACSGAETSTYTDSSGDFKPGIDFYDSGSHEGQALLLEQYAATHDVKLIVLSIGGNNFNFASIVEDCVVDFLTTPSWWPDYCKNDSSVKADFTAANVATQTAAIAGAIRNVIAAMTADGYGSSQYTLLLQNYPSPIPPSSGFRYSQSGFTRQSVGGCGFWNADADWANSTALPTINGAVANAVAQVGAPNVSLLNIASAFNGRRLCENTVGLLEEKGLASWQSPGAVDETEWINQIRTVSTIGSPYFIQESLHPNYWGELALRNCVRQAYDGGTPHGGTCTIASTGLDAQGEPQMALH